MQQWLARFLHLSRNQLVPRKCSFDKDWHIIKSARINISIYDTNHPFHYGSQHRVKSVFFFSHDRYSRCDRYLFGVNRWRVVSIWSLRSLNMSVVQPSQRSKQSYGYQALRGSWVFFWPRFIFLELCSCRILFSNRVMACRIFYLKITRSNSS